MIYYNTSKARYDHASMIQSAPYITDAPSGQLNMELPCVSFMRSAGVKRGERVLLGNLGKMAGLVP